MVQHGCVPFSLVQYVKLHECNKSTTGSTGCKPCTAYAILPARRGALFTFYCVSFLITLCTADGLIQLKPNCSNIAQDKALAGWPCEPARF